MLSITTNTSSLIAQTSLKTSTNKLNQAIERMSTGSKINRAKDNAANYSIATNMTTKINALQVAEDNVKMGLDMLATATNSLELISEKLTRLRALQEKVANGTYSRETLDIICTEANSLVDEIQRIYFTTTYNEINLFEPHSESTTEPENIPKAQYDGFIQKVTKRNTSSMTSLGSVAEDSAITSGTYSISTPEELAKLATMTNNGLIGKKAEFVLANDIDLSQYEDWTPIGEVSYNNGWIGKHFQASFDGNGYTISNLHINSNKAYRGFFGYLEGSAKNIFFKDVDVYTTEQVGAIAGMSNGTVYNSVVIGNVTGERYAAGALVGNLQSGGSIDNCYAEATVSSISVAGGLVGALCSNVSNSYFKGSVHDMETPGGGIAGRAYNKVSIDSCFVELIGNTNCAFVGDLSESNNAFSIKNSSYKSAYNLNLYKNPYSLNVDLRNITSYITPILSTELQVGINADASSSILVNTSLCISNFDSLRIVNDYYIKKSGINYSISNVDKFISIISTKQVELGSVQNRLASVLDDIAIKNDNLVLYKSTIKDSDISDVSSEYIKMQILQQASATMLATANQTPAIALQLL